MSNCRLQHIQPILGETFRFYVPSVSRPELPHTVDLESYKFNGECDCERFHFNCGPLLSRGAIKAEHLRCGHIKDARSYFLDEVLPRIAGAVHSAVKESPRLRAEGAITEIIVAPPDKYALIEKRADLSALIDHAVAGLQQLDQAA